MPRMFHASLLAASLFALALPARADPLEYIDKPVRGVPVSQAVKQGKFVFVSGTPGFGPDGKLAVGDFAAQMKQVMENIAAVLRASGAGWDRVVKTNVLLIRPADFT